MSTQPLIDHKLKKPQQQRNQSGGGSSVRHLFSLFTGGGGRRSTTSPQKKKTGSGDLSKQRLQMIRFLQNPQHKQILDSIQSIETSLLPHTYQGLNLADTRLFLKSVYKDLVDPRNEGSTPFAETIQALHAYTEHMYNITISPKKFKSLSQTAQVNLLGLVCYIMDLMLDQYIKRVENKINHIMEMYTTSKQHIQQKKQTADQYLSKKHPQTLQYISKLVRQQLAKRSSSQSDMTIVNGLSGEIINNYKTSMKNMFLFLEFLEQSQDPPCREMLDMSHSIVDFFTHHSEIFQISHSTTREILVDLFIRHDPSCPKFGRHFVSFDKKTNRLVLHGKQSIYPWTHIDVRSPTLSQSIQKCISQHR